MATAKLFREVAVRLDVADRGSRLRPPDTKEHRSQTIWRLPYTGSAKCLLTTTPLICYARHTVFSDRGRSRSSGTRHPDCPGRLQG